MKKLLLLITVAVMLSGCVVYPGTYGYYDSGYYGYPYGSVTPNISLYYSGFYGGGGHYGGFGRYGGYGHYGGYGGYGHYGGHGGHGGWHH